LVHCEGLAQQLLVVRQPLSTFAACADVPADGCYIASSGYWVLRHFGTFWLVLRDAAAGGYHLVKVCPA
jgi:hypothetical protein